MNGLTAGTAVSDPGRRRGRSVARARPASASRSAARRPRRAAQSPTPTRRVGRRPAPRAAASAHGRTPPNRSARPNSASPTRKIRDAAAEGAGRRVCPEMRRPRNSRDQMSGIAEAGPLELERLGRGAELKVGRAVEVRPEIVGTLGESNRQSGRRASRQESETKFRRLAALQRRKRWCPRQGWPGR